MTAGDGTSAGLDESTSDWAPRPKPRAPSRFRSATVDFVPSVPPNKPLPRDPVVEAYKKHVDITLIRENLKLTPTERFEQLMKLQEFASELTAAGRRLGR